MKILNPPRDDAPLQLVFRGECLDGHDMQTVRQAVASALKLDERREARLFSGERVVLRRNVNTAAAHRHIARFALLGAVLHAEPSKARAESVPARATQERPARARGRRRLLWVGAGVLCTLGGLVLALVSGPGLNALWPQAPVSANTVTSRAETVAPQAPPPAQAVADVRPARAPVAAASASADEEIPQDMTAAALGEYRQRYLPAPNHKAFAISSGGAHAWHAGAASDHEARDRALTSCLAARRPGDDGCRIVDADGAGLE
jgi:hypothetical protein